MPRTPEAARLVEVAVTVEVLRPPSVQSLYFWALQVDFEEGGLGWGGGHTGLQWNPRFAGSAALNWGGYASQERGGAVLPGTDPILPAFSGDPNTMAYPWKPGSAYRLRVFQSPELFGAWRAEIIDVASGNVKQVIPGLTKRSNRVKFTPDGKQVLISDLAAGDVLVLDAAKRGVVKTLHLGGQPEGILITPDGSRAFVATGAEGNKIVVIDLKSLAVSGEFQPGADPDGMAWVQ
jgi:YVTN family beta-propeller protein